MTKQTLFISKIGTNWFTILSIHLPIGITIKNTINCTEGVEFYHGMWFCFISLEVSENNVLLLK
jgi:hypothetical protein